MPKLLLTADLHLTDRSKDEYRWSIFPWLKKQAINRRADGICILGDITHFKDEHTGSFLNRIIDAFIDLSEVCPIGVLMGNHDYMDESAPSLRQLGLLPNVSWFGSPKRLRWCGADVFWLPHQKNAAEFERLVKAEFAKSMPDLVFVHQCIEGSESSSGQALGGVNPYNMFPKGAPVFAGDIHVPQTVANRVTYTGAPYPIDFGDHYSPRIIEYTTDTRTSVSIKRSTICKRTLRITDLKELEKEELFEGDHIRIIFELSRSEIASWHSYRERIEQLFSKMGVILDGVELRTAVNAPIAEPQLTETHSTASILDAYGKAANLPEDFVAEGKRLLDVSA